MEIEVNGTMHIKEIRIFNINCNHKIAMGIVMSDLMPKFQWSFLEWVQNAETTRDVYTIQLSFLEDEEVRTICKWFNDMKFTYELIFKRVIQ